MGCVRSAVIAVTATLAIGCDDAGTRRLPTAPWPTPLTVDSLTIGGADAVLTGSSAIFTVSAALSDGTTRAETPTPTWTSSNPRVATVDAAGRLEGVSHGSTSLTVSLGGRSASKTVQVVNNYGGNWVGSYVIRACDDTGELKERDGGWCGTYRRVGTVVSIHLTLSQTGELLDEVRVTQWGSDLGEGDSITGAVAADGRLKLAGTVNIWDWEGWVVLARLQVSAWDTNLSSPGVMTGRWSENHVVYSPTGTVFQENEIVTLTRTSTSATTAPAAR